MARRGPKTAVLDASGPAAGASGAADGAVSVASKTPGTMMSLAGESLRYCESLAANGGVLSHAFKTRPSFLFASDDEEAAALDRLRVALSGSGAPVSVVQDNTPDQSTVPGIGPSVSRIVGLTGEGHMLGYEATEAFLAGSGAERIWPCRLLTVEDNGDHVRVVTSTGDLRARQLVLATGIGTTLLFPELPLIPRSGQLIITDRTAGLDCEVLPGPLTSAAYLLSKSDRHIVPTRAPVVIDPLRTGQLLIGSSREDNGSEAQTDFATMRRILSSAVACLPSLARRRVLRVFAGLRTASGDGRPIVGAVPGAPNVYIATGFEGDGICLAPIIGREIANLLTGAPVRAALDSLAPSRFFEQRAAV